MILGHTLLGKGPQKVIIMHDFFTDCESDYKLISNFLDIEKFAYAFMDMRGYGKSREILGEYTTDEVASDIENLANHLGWEKFHVVGHSMSGKVVQKAAVKLPERIQSAIAIAPTPASGLPLEPEQYEFFKASVHSKEVAMQAVGFLSGDRLPAKWAFDKIEHWHKIADRNAASAYIKMVVEEDFSKEANGNEVPLLVIVGKQDMGGANAEIMQGTILQWFKNAELGEIVDAGHYPMEETPLLLVATIEKFMAANA